MSWAVGSVYVFIYLLMGKSTTTCDPYIIRRWSTECVSVTVNDLKRVYNWCNWIFISCNLEMKQPGVKNVCSWHAAGFRYNSTLSFQKIGGQHTSMSGANQLFWEVICKFVCLFVSSERWRDLFVESKCFSEINMQHSHLESSISVRYGTFKTNSTCADGRLKLIASENNLHFESFLKMYLL